MQVNPCAKKFRDSVAAVTQAFFRSGPALMIHWTGVTPEVSLQGSSCRSPGSKYSHFFFLFVLEDFISPSLMKEISLDMEFQVIGFVFFQREIFPSTLFLVSEGKSDVTIILVPLQAGCSFPPDPTLTP